MIIHLNRVYMKWAVVAYIKDDQTLAVECCRFGRALEIPASINRLPECDVLITLHILGTFADRAEAINFAKQARPRKDRRSALRCVETGKEYESIASAAADLECTASYISNYLAGRKGFATVKGYNFERI